MFGRSKTAKSAPKPADGELRMGLVRLVEDDQARGVRAGTRLRNYFLTGLVIVGPVTITVYIVWWFINVVDAWVKPFVPDIYNPDKYLPFSVPGLGLVFAIVGLTLIGALAANLLGRTLISYGELMVSRMPIVRNVYSALKQIFESVVTASDPSNGFQKVGLIEFPSKGIWSIVFVTAEATRQVASAVGSGKDMITVFMPTAIVPPTGFTVFIPKNEVIFLDMSVEDAAKIIVSAGMVTPDAQERLKALAQKPRAKTKPLPEAPASDVKQTETT